MLSITQKRYLDICIVKIAKNVTNEALAERFSCNRSLVDRALLWGRRNDIFTLDSKRKLLGHIQELHITVNKLEQAFRIHARKPRDREARKKWKPDASALSRLARELLEYRTRIMELEGIYKHVVNIEHAGTITVADAIIQAYERRKELKLIKHSGN